VLRFERRGSALLLSVQLVKQIPGRTRGRLLNRGWTRSWLGNRACLEPWSQTHIYKTLVVGVFSAFWHAERAYVVLGFLDQMRIESLTFFSRRNLVDIEGVPT